MGEAAALIAAFTWSGTSVAMASLVARTTPVAMSALRLSVATLLMPLILAFSGQAGDIGEASGWTILAMVGSGLLAYAIGDTMYIGALAQLGVQRAFTVAQALFISLTVAGGIVLLDEPFRWYQGIGSLLIGAGIWLVMRERLATRAPGDGDADSVALPGSPGHPGMAAYGLIAVIAVFWASATLWLAGERGDMGAIAASTLRTPAGAIGVVAFAAATARHDLVAPFRDRRRLAAIAAVGIMGTGFGSLLYVYAVGEAGAARTSVLSAVSPLMALPLAVAFLGERITRPVIAGTVLCVAGIVLVVL
jgi:drug/metabolite transporter (DMT)-like permease